MGLMKEVFKKEQAQLAKDREEMHKRNIKHMEELNKILPTPTREECNYAQRGKARPADEPKVEAVVEEKVVAPAAPSGGGYKTRDMSAKKDS